MTKEANARKQRIWQLKRKLKMRLAFRWLMARICGSEKGFRLIKTALRRVARNPQASPGQQLEAAKWLLFIETGAKKVDYKDLTPVRAEEVDPNAPPSNPVIKPNDTDSDLEKLLKRYNKK
jgi:hypothetical protein